jgi:hypothetical protein
MLKMNVFDKIHFLTTLVGKASLLKDKERPAWREGREF